MEIKSSGKSFCGFKLYLPYKKRELSFSLWTAPLCYLAINAIIRHSVG
jgi:hypothetical protein